MNACFNVQLNERAHGKGGYVEMEPVCSDISFRYKYRRGISDIFVSLPQRDRYTITYKQFGYIHFKKGLVFISDYCTSGSGSIPWLIQKSDSLYVGEG